MSEPTSENQANTSPCVLVTGANRGIGLELCRQLVAARARVIATVRRPEAAQELATLPVSIEALDVSDPESVEALAERLDEVELDVLVNNAGMGGVGDGIQDLDFENMQEAFAVNSLGPLRVTQALLPHLLRGQRRTVVHISSNMGSLTNNLQGGCYAYRASKTALNMLNRCLALELAGKGFTCTVLHPGWVQTDMGGEGAPVPVVESVRGLLRVIVNLTPEDNGRFLDFEGKELPW